MSSVSATINATDKRVVFGLGITGQSVARWWQQKGINFTAIDTRADMVSDPVVLEHVNSQTAVFGEVDTDIIDGCTEMIVSPGVALDHPIVTHARNQGCRIRGDIDLFMEAAQAPVVGITGSNGKSTVTALLGEMLRACGLKVSLGGNLGRPALDLLADDPELYVLELSSFQLERAHDLGLRLATVLNISADHLDRYANLGEYHRAKHLIFRQVTQVVANRDDPLTIPLMPETLETVWWRSGEPDFDEFGLREIDGVNWICHGFNPLISGDALQLPGRHNLANLLAALALGSALGLPTSGLLEGAREYRGLPHRCQLVRQIGGVRFIDDSKGTNIGATVAALEGLAGEGAIWLILGGQGKGQDFSLLKETVAQCCSGVVVLGEATADITKHLSQVITIQSVDTIEEAVACAAAQAQTGDTVLLSPACASLDMFASYVDRGQKFHNAVNALEVVA